MIEIAVLVVHTVCWESSWIPDAKSVDPVAAFAPASIVFAAWSPSTLFDDILVSELSELFWSLSELG